MSPSSTDRLAGLVLGVAAWISAGLALFIAIWVGIEAWPAFRDVGLGRMLTDERWLPSSNREPQFGVLPILGGSLLVTIMATVPAAVVGILCAIYQHFYATRFVSTLLRRILELLAGIPSVVIGFWGLVVLVPFLLRWDPEGQSLLAGSIVLSIMIVPTVALTACSAFQNVAPDHFRAAAALGIGRVRTILNVALPAAWTGISGGIILAATRAIGETMAVLMVCGNIAEWPGSILDPILPVTSAIALEMGYAQEAHKAMLFALAFLLVVLVGIAVCWMAFRKKDQ